ncbi:MAG: hypothetical protein HKN20_07820 [Gemmatimonadetes bacterium]|nr:hypothetical protein [Gemmatimonadota bacterium]
MKTTAYLLLLLLLGSVVLLVGCSANPTEPAENDPPDVEEPIATATIGAGGGTIDAEGIVLSVPAGAFDADETISLYRSKESKPFGTDQITDE